MKAGLSHPHLTVRLGRIPPRTNQKRGATVAITSCSEAQETTVPMNDTSANASEPIPTCVSQGDHAGMGRGHTNLTVTVDPARSVNHQENVHIHWALEQCSVTTTCRAASTEKPRTDGEEGSTV